MWRGASGYDGEEDRMEREGFTVGDITQDRAPEHWNAKILREEAEAARESGYERVSEFNYVTRDSGERTQHTDGVQRDRQHGKTKFPLLFPKDIPLKDQLMVRVAELYTRGGEKYGDRNWENSRAEDTLEHHTEALWRHFINFFYEVDDGEDHAAAIVWNINAVELTRRNLREDSEVKPEPAIPDDSPYYDHAEGEPVLREDLPVIALRDNQGDYWQPNDDATFDCWPSGCRPDDSSCAGWSLKDIEDAGFGPTETVYVRYEPLPWD